MVSGTVVAVACGTGFLEGPVGWPLIPDGMDSILLPDAKNILVRSAIDSDVSVAAGCFFFAGARVGLFSVILLHFSKD